MMENSKVLLEIVIPTYNHVESIANIVEWYEKTIDDNDNVVISIHDSSTSEKIENIVKNSYLFPKKMKYFRYEPTMDVDEKTVLAIKTVEAQYGFLVGDGFLVKVDNVLNYLLNIPKIVDVNCIYMANLGTGFKKYFNKYYSETTELNRENFFKINYWHTIFYGSSILSKEFIDRIDINEVVNKYNKTGFIYPSSILLYAESFYVSTFDNLLSNDKRGMSGWIINKTALEIFAKKLYLTLESYRGTIDDETVNYLEKSINKTNGLFSIKTLLSFRANGNLTFKLYNQYKYYIKRMNGYSSLRFISILLVPSFILKIMKKFKKILKGNK